MVRCQGAVEVVVLAVGVVVLLVDRVVQEEVEEVPEQEAIVFLLAMPRAVGIR